MRPTIVARRASQVDCGRDHVIYKARSNQSQDVTGGRSALIIPGFAHRPTGILDAVFSTKVLSDVMAAVKLVSTNPGATAFT
jgi:hypothetical protein